MFHVLDRSVYLRSQSLFVGKRGSCLSLDVVVNIFKYSGMVQVVPVSAGTLACSLEFLICPLEFLACPLDFWPVLWNFCPVIKGIDEICGMS